MTDSTQSAAGRPNTGRPNKGRPNKGKVAKDLNATIRYTMWSVFRLRDVLGAADREAEAAEVEKLFAELEGADVTVRGLYDIAGLRADADLMVWWHAETADELQDAYHRFRRTAFGGRLDAPDLQLPVVSGRGAAFRGEQGRRRHSGTPPRCVRRAAR